VTPSAGIRLGTFSSEAADFSVDGGRVKYHANGMNTSSAKTNRRYTVAMADDAVI